MEFTQENLVLLIVSGTMVLGFLAISIVWLTVRNFKRQMKHQRDVFRHVMEAQEKERHRISRDLHEGIGADISAIKLLAGSINCEQNEDGEAIKNIIGHIDNTVESIRGIIRNLRPHEFTKVGLKGALTNFIQKIESNFPVKVNITLSGMDERMNDIVEINIYRIIQELINNTVKHSDAKFIFLKIEINDDNFTIHYKDDGQGFDEEKIIPGMGTGNLKARVDFFEGKMKLVTKPGQGVYYRIGFTKEKLHI